MGEKLVALGLKVLDADGHVDPIPNPYVPEEENDDEAALHTYVALSDEARAMLMENAPVPPERAKELEEPLIGSLAHQIAIERARREMG